MTWYNLTPAQYAEGLRYNAKRNEERATRLDQEACMAREDSSRPFYSRKEELADNAAFARRQARRLRAMATLCDLSAAERAGKVDFRRLDDPTCPRDLEDATVAEIEGLC